MGSNKKYKDSIVRALFNKPEKALGLYCDIKGIAYDPSVLVEMKSLDVQFMPQLRNDISFVIDGVLVVFFEHQASLNKNMPLRLLQYIVMFFAAYYKMGSALYANALIKLPMPEFYVLYNGKSSYPPTGELRLSDAYMTKGDGAPPSLELVVKVININYQSLSPNLQKNEDIYGYAYFVSKVDAAQKQGLALSDALRKAVDECISEGILVEFFEQYRNEVESMFTLVYDEEMAKKVAREEGKEEGKELGKEEGKEIGFAESLEILQLLKENMPSHEIASRYHVSIEQVELFQPYARAAST